MLLTRVSFCDPLSKSVPQYFSDEVTSLTVGSSTILTWFNINTLTAEMSRSNDPRLLKVREHPKSAFWT